MLFLPASKGRELSGAVDVVDRRGERAHLLCEELFHDALVRERKRADRFEEAFVTILVTLDRQRLDDTAVRQLASAMVRAETGADVIGWLERDAVLGLIRSVAIADLGDTVKALTESVRHVVARSVTPFLAGSCACRCEIYSSQSDLVSPVILDPGNSRHKPRYLLAIGAKRALDLCGSAACLVAFSPIFLGVAAAVKLTSKGPVLFRQERVGQSGRPFKMLKFRTMRVGTDERIHKEYVEKFIEQGQAATTGKDAVFKLVTIRDHARRSFLRKTA